MNNAHDMIVFKSKSQGEMLPNLYVSCTAVIQPAFSITYPEKHYHDFIDRSQIVQKSFSKINSKPTYCKSLQIPLFLKKCPWHKHQQFVFQL